MNRITKHIPGAAFDGRDRPPPSAEFETLDELLAIPFVSHWAEGHGWLRFSQWPANGNLLSPEPPTLLMAEMKDGSWWVVGHLAGWVVGLPTWLGGQTIVRLPPRGEGD